TETLFGYSLNTDVGDFDDGFNEPQPLAADHTFTRVNPSIGFTVTPNEDLTLFASYNEASRAPTVVELGCSDPENPCGLPNELASARDLRQVVARRFEVGARGSVNGDFLKWSVDVFHTTNQTDIQFIATTTSQGSFANVGNTRRQGLDLAVGGKIQNLSW